MTSDQINDFTKAWFRALDVHVPVEECLTMLADKGLYMHFPDGDIVDFAAFQKWYKRVTNLFFDEQHTLLNLEVFNQTTDIIDVRLRVRWQSGWWEPPAATSNRIDAEVNQKWTVRKCAPDKNPFGIEILEYHVSDDFAYASGSAVLPSGKPFDPQDLVALNNRIGEMEQAGDDEAFKFFQALLSDGLIFRRANGKIVGKTGATDSFLSTLKKTPFLSREFENIVVAPIDDRALVTLTVIGTFATDGSVHRYRNIRLFSRVEGKWILEFWYNYEVTDL